MPKFASRPFALHSPAAIPPLLERLVTYFNHSHTKRKTYTLTLFSAKCFLK